MATNRIDAINERRARMQAAQDASPLPGSPLPGTSPGQVADSRADAAPAQITYANSGIAPTITSNQSYRRGALQNMDEGQFKRAQAGMNASEKEYWSEQVKLDPLNTYANLRNYLASDETPEEQRKRERREQLGQVFSNLGNLIGNAANLYYTAKGAYPANLNTGAIAANERMQRIKEKRDALKEKQDELLAQARSTDVRNAYNMRLAREKAQADAAEKQKGRDLDMLKWTMKLEADKDKSDADRKIKERQMVETGRHNRAMESNTRSSRNKVLDSGVSSDGNIYTRNSKMSDAEAAQLALKYLTEDELRRFERGTTRLVYNPETGELENERNTYIDWDAALGEVLKSGKVPPEELVSRGFVRSGSQGGSGKKSLEGYGAPATAKGKKTLEGFGNN